MRSRTRPRAPCAPIFVTHAVPPNATDLIEICAGYEVCAEVERIWHNGKGGEGWPPRYKLTLAVVGEYSRGVVAGRDDGSTSSTTSKHVDEHRGGGDGARAGGDGEEAGGQRWRQLTVGYCVLVQKMDSYGDGWNNAEYIIKDSTGELVASGTLESGSSGTDELCHLLQGCYTMSVSSGQYPTEIGWQVAQEGVVLAEGGAPSTVGGWCVQPLPTSTPTSTPWPTITYHPTKDEPTAYRALSSLYTGTHMRILSCCTALKFYVIG